MYQKAQAFNKRAPHHWRFSTRHYPVQNPNLDAATRMHAQLIRRPWAKLWYLARGTDQRGRGIVCLSWETIRQATGAATSTIYEWLRHGKRDGAFRYWTSRKDAVIIFLASRNRLSAALGLQDWGATAVVTLREILQQSRFLGTEAQILKQQEASRYAAIKQKQIKGIRVPRPETVLNAESQIFPSSSQPDSGATVNCVLHVDTGRVYVAGGFIPYGASQRSVSRFLGVSDRTVRRHIKRQGMTAKQLAQYKPEYKQLKRALDFEASECGSASMLWQDWNHRSARETTVLITDGRLVEWLGKVWLLRCNLYGSPIAQQLTSEKYARLKYKKYLSVKNRARGGGER